MLLIHLSSLVVYHEYEEQWALCVASLKTINHNFLYAFSCRWTESPQKRKSIQLLLNKNYLFCICTVHRLSHWMTNADSFREIILVPQCKFSSRASGRTMNKCECHLQPNVKAVLLRTTHIDNDQIQLLMWPTFFLNTCSLRMVCESDLAVRKEHEHSVLNIIIYIFDWFQNEKLPTTKKSFYIFLRKCYKNIVIYILFPSN